MTNTNETTNEELKTHRAEHMDGDTAALHDEACIFCKADNEGKQYAAYIELVGEEYATLEDCEDTYEGEYESDKDFAMQLAEDIGQVPDANGNWPLYCIDWDYAARDLMMDYSEQDGYYFRNN